jgi:MATE family multidrug resistance protein
MAGARTGWRGDVARLLQLAWPIVLTQLALMLMGTVDYMMVGRAGVLEIGAVMLGNVWKMGTLMVGMGVIFGLAPLVSQAHGAGDGARAGLALQRGVVLGLVLSVPIGLAWLAARPVLVHLGQDPQIAARAASYLHTQIVSLPFFLVWMAQREYLQGRGIVLPTFFLALLVNALNAGLNWVLIFGNLGAPALGAVGAGWATCTMQVALPFLTWLWIRRARLAEGAWTPWSRAALDRRGLGEVLHLGLPVALALLLEMWAFQTMTLWSGALGPEPLAAHSFVLNMASLSFMVPLGIALAATTRVGNLIGAGDPHAAQRAAWTAFALAGLAMACFGALYALCPRALSRLYTDDPALIARAAAVLPIAAAFQVFDGLQVVGGGILRGMGKTKPPLLIHFLGFYGLGLPLAWFLTFRAGLGLAGLWWGIALGLFAVAVAFVVWIALRGPAHVHARLVRPPPQDPGALPGSQSPQG